MLASNSFVCKNKKREIIVAGFLFFSVNLVVICEAFASSDVTEKIIVGKDFATGIQRLKEFNPLAKDHPMPVRSEIETTIAGRNLMLLREKGLSLRLL